MSILLESREELVEEDHLAAVRDDSPEGLLAKVRARLGAFEEEGMVRGLLELHRDVEEGDSRIGSTESRVVLREQESGRCGRDRERRRRTLVRMFLYHQVCMLDISTRRMRSLFVGSSLMTSRLRRRSMMDSSLPWRSRILASFSSSANDESVAARTGGVGGRTVEIKVASERELLRVQEMHERQQLCKARQGISGSAKAVDEATHP